MNTIVGQTRRSAPGPPKAHQLGFLRARRSRSLRFDLVRSLFSSLRGLVHALLDSVFRLMGALYDSFTSILAGVLGFSSGLLEVLFRSLLRKGPREGESGDCSNQN